MSLERYAHLYDLMQRGNTAFREDRLDQVICPPNYIILLDKFFICDFLSKIGLLFCSYCVELEECYLVGGLV